MKWSRSWAGYTTESSIMLCPMIAIYQYFKRILSDNMYLIFCFFLYNFFEHFRKAKESNWTLSNRLLVSCISWWAMCQLSTCFQAKPFCWQWAICVNICPCFRQDHIIKITAENWKIKNHELEVFVWQWTHMVSRTNCIAGSCGKFKE